MNRAAYIFAGCMLLAWLCAIGTVQAQDYGKQRKQIAEKQKDIQIQISKINDQIGEYEKRLKYATKKYETLYKKYKDLQKVIALQDQKLKKMRAQQDQLKKEISVTEQSISQKKQQLAKLIDRYKKTLSYLYKHGRTSELALILSSPSINKMIIRSFYLKKFNAYRGKQVQQIRDKEQELRDTKKELVNARAKNKKVLADITDEKNKLAKKKKQQSHNVKLLRKNKQKIQHSLQRTVKEKENLNSRFSQLIEADKNLRKKQQVRRQKLEAKRKQKLAAAKKIKDDTKRAKEVAKYSEPVKEKNYMSSKELKKIGDRFASKKGKLSWPVNSRTVSEHFGRRRHPVFGTYTPNPGIEIVTDAQERVRVVQDGYVIAIEPLPGYGDVILVKHGKFITAYGNLSKIMVTKNEILNKGDIVGLSGDKDSTKGESLFFLIRKNNKNLDPEHWLMTEPVSDASN